MTLFRNQIRNTFVDLRGIHQREMKACARSPLPVLVECADRLRSKQPTARLEKDTLLESVQADAVPPRRSP